MGLRRPGPHRAAGAGDYNDTYNNLRPRLFDGSHLDFPGMSKAVRPCGQHQKDAIWRCMTGGNTLLAHVVGAGKTRAWSPRP